MRSERRWPLLAVPLVVCAVLLGAWWGSGDGTDRHGVEPAASSGAAQASRPGTLAAVEFGESPASEAESERELVTGAQPPSDSHEDAPDLLNGMRITLRGVLLDQAGLPIAGVRMWITREARNARSNLDHIYFGAGDEDDLLANTTTDPDGGFAFEDVPWGEWWVGPEAPSESFGAAVQPRSDVAPVATRVVLVGGGEQSIELRVERGLYITGRTVLPDGEPAKLTQIHSSSELGNSRCFSVTDEFRLGPVSSHAHTLRAVVRDNYAKSEPLKAWPGDPDLVLALRVGASFQGTFVDAESGEPCKAMLMTASAETRIMRWGSRPKPSPFHVQGFGPGRYHLTASTEDGRIGTLRNLDLRRGESRENLVIELRAGSQVRVFYHGPASFANLRLKSEGAAIAGAGIRSGSAEVITVPPGQILVQLSFGTDLIEEREVFCEPGLEAEVLFGIQ